MHDCIPVSFSFLFSSLLFSPHPPFFYLFIQNNYFFSLSSFVPLLRRAFLLLGGIEHSTKPAKNKKVGPKKKTAAAPGALLLSTAPNDLGP
jgi:hypothetical protein